MPNLLVILSLISFLSIIIVTGSKSYTHLYENNNHIPLKLTPIYAQDNSGDFEDGDIFPDFKIEGSGGKEDSNIFPDFKIEGSGGKEKDEGGDGGKEKDGEKEVRINENTNDTNGFSPLSSGSPTNTDDKVNPYDEVGQPVGQQSEQQTIGNEVNQTEQPQDTGEQSEQQTIGTNQTEQQTIGTNQTEQQTIGTNQTEQPQDTGEQVEQQTIGTNQTEQQTIGNEVNQTEQP